jgi:hypothetical protein
MNKVVTPAERLDEVCGQFVGEFSLDPVGYGDERTAIVDDLTLSMAMSRLVLHYKTPEEQQAFFETADNNILESLGNPSARISTYTATGQMALYNFDRTTGLVVVNNFGFPKGEARALRANDVEALGFSIATRGICRSASMARALTDTGVERLIQDFNTAIREA